MRAYATAAALAVAGEPIVLAILRMPNGRAAEPPSGRLIVLTGTRSIEVAGHVPNDWWSAFAWSTNQPLETRLSVRPLNQFTEITVDAEARTWLLPDPVRQGWTYGTSATLTGPGVEPLTLWTRNEPTHGHDAQALLTALHRLTLFTTDRLAEPLAEHPGRA